MSANNFELYTTYSVTDTLSKYRKEMEALEDSGPVVVGSRTAEAILEAEEKRVAEHRKQMRELAEADFKAEQEAKGAEGISTAQHQAEQSRAEHFEVTEVARQERRRDDEIAKQKSDAASHIRTDEAYIAYSLEMRRELEAESKALLKAQRDKALRTVLGQCEREEAEGRRGIEFRWYEIGFFTSEAVGAYFAYVKANVFERSQSAIAASVTSDAYSKVRIQLKRYLERPIRTVGKVPSYDEADSKSSVTSASDDGPLSISEAFLLCTIAADLRCRDRITATAEARRASEWNATASAHMSALDNLLVTEAASIKKERRRLEEAGIVDDSTLGPIDRSPFNRFDFYHNRGAPSKQQLQEYRAPHPLSTYVTLEEQQKRDTIAARAALNADKWRAKVFDDEVTRAVYYASALEFRSTDTMAKYL